MQWGYSTKILFQFINHLVLSNENLKTSFRCFRIKIGIFSTDTKSKAFIKFNLVLNLKHFKYFFILIAAKLWQSSLIQYCGECLVQTKATKRTFSFCCKHLSRIEARWNSLPHYTKFIFPYELNFPICTAPDSTH